ncbi:MAG TPA: nuclear transport factor 2 family protein [Chitinophaga sp.]
MLRELVDQYKQLLEQGDTIAVIEQFYDDNIYQLENDEETIVGKQRLLDLERQSLEKVNELILRVPTLVVDEEQQVVMGEMMITFYHKTGGLRFLKEAFIQHWENGRIVKQQFYYRGIRSAEGPGKGVNSTRPS